MSKNCRGIVMLSRKNILILLLCLFSLTTQALAEKIDLRDESVSREILIGDWNCSISERYYTGPLYWSIEEIDDNKFTGSSVMCGNRVQMTGKIKKNSISFKIGASASCPTGYAGKLKYKPDDILKFKGTFSKTGEGGGERGKIACNTK